MTASRWWLAILTTFFITVATSGLSAQQFGGNPPSLKWRQINTDTVRVIFPTGLDHSARQVAAIVHRLSRSTLPTIGPHQHKIDIILQNQTIISNGYVALAPFRSEFQVTAEQNSFDLGSLPWTKTLAIHEYRHVQQFNNFRVGLSGAFYYLFGEEGQALANTVAIPNWFWEGDAVYQETLVSDQGRGRLPWFFNGYRSLRAAHKNYSWMKLRNGSLRDYVPDHYPLGYMLVAYGREKYGDGFWRSVTHDAAAFHGLFYPLQTAIRRYSGLSFPQFRRVALDYFRQPPGLSAASMDAASPSSADSFARAHRHFDANEEFPQYIGRHSILFMRTSYKQIPAFTLRNGGHDIRLRPRAISLDNYFSYSNGRVVYAAYETDPRWGWRDYNVIRLFDLATGDDRRLTHRTRLFSPDISPDGRQIVAVEQATDGSCSLHLLDAATGTTLTQLPNTDSLFYTYPKFGGDHIITAVRNRKGQMSLARIDTVDGSAAYLLPFSYQTIGFLSVKGDTIWFTASRNGQDRTYALAGGTIYRFNLPHGDPLTGQYQFHAGPGGQYTWNTFTAVGFRLDHTDTRLEFQTVDRYDWAHALPLQGIDSLDSGPSGILDRIAPGHYPTTKYPMGSHLINFHSWRPYINDPDYQFSLISNNILNTLQAELFVSYNRNEQYKQVGADATYAGLYPWIDAGWNYTFDRNALFRGHTVYWNESEIRAGSSIPLYFVRGRSFTSLQFGSDLVYNQRHYTGLYKDSFNSRAFAYIDPYISFVNQIQQAPQQIYPRLAQVVSLSYSRAVSALQANQFLASGYLYLPGLAYTHNLVLAAAFQQRDTLNNARFSNGFPFSRGYTAENFYRMWRWSASYHLPLVYPDWGIGNIVYFLRVRANLYYDYTRALDFYTNGRAFDALYRSYGSEVYFDTKWWNQLPISFGIRYSRLVDPDFAGRAPNQWELILPLNILSQGYSNRAVRPID